ncbi:MAG: hypothetical protein Q9195_005010 [Heterodermia aff. obscurata]
MASPSITDLAASISRNTQIVHDYFVAKNLPLPSFDVNGPQAITIPPEEKEVTDARKQLLSDTQALQHLTMGPVDLLRSLGSSATNDVLSLQAMRRFKVGEKFGLEEKASFDALAKACKVNVVDLRRLIRYAMTNHIFREEGGLVMHTAASRLLTENELLNDVVGVATEELFPGATKTLDALVKYDGFHAPNQSGFSQGHNTDKGLYDELRQYPERANRFANAISGLAKRMSTDPLARGYDWAAIDAAGGTVVDVGGGRGAVSIALARQFPNIKFIVQDFADVVAGGPEDVPPELKDKIEFMGASCLDEQPLKGKDVYFLRAVLHNWPDDSCVKILQNLLPGKLSCFLFPGRSAAGPRF